jgi:hypothetical protein
METLLERDDTDGDSQITIDDHGPQVRKKIIFSAFLMTANIQKTNRSSIWD